MILSIILPSFKRPELLKVGLNSILNQNIKDKYEVIVLNDGIVDKTEEVCKQFKDKMNIKYIFTGQRNKDKLTYRCPGFAINLGVKNALGKYILLSCPEIFYLTDNCINDMLKLIKENEKSLIIPEMGYDDQQGITSKRIIGGEKINIELEPISELNIYFPFCLLLNKYEFEYIGGYDEDFTGYCYDDADLVNRLNILRGNKYILAENNKIIHLFHGARTKRDGLEDRHKKLNYNRDLFNQRKNIAIRNKKGVVSVSEREKEFTDTYIHNKFKGKVSKSGAGSDLENVNILIPRLIGFLNEYNISSMIDAPCGDFNWMPLVLEKATTIKEYKGYDIVNKLVDDNKKKYPNIYFEQKDIILDNNLGKADLLFCRDCLVHLSHASIKQFIKNFFFSNIKYLLTTTFPEKGLNSQFNIAEDGTNWFPLNLEAPPFSLPKPTILINEGCTECNNQFTDKSLGLWKKEDLINRIILL